MHWLIKVNQVNQLTIATAKDLVISVLYKSSYQRYLLALTKRLLQALLRRLHSNLLKFELSPFELNAQRQKIATSGSKFVASLGDCRRRRRPPPGLLRSGLTPDGPIQT